MKKDKIKNKFFKSTIKIAGNKGLGKNFLGKSIMVFGQKMSGKNSDYFKNHP